MSNFDTPKSTRSGRIRLSENEIRRKQEEKREFRQKRLNHPTQQQYSSQTSSDSEEIKDSDSNEFISGNDSPTDQNLSTKLESTSFTDPNNTIPQNPSIPANYLSSVEPLRGNYPEPKNSLDNLDEDPIFNILRRSLLEKKPKMADQPQFQTSEFHKLIPVYDGSVKDLQHFISCCDFFYKTLDAGFRNTFYEALVSKLKSKAFDLYNNHQYRDWPEFKIALKKYFSVRKTFEIYQLELANIRQGKLSIQDYSQKIEEILREMNNIGRDIRVDNASGEKFFKAQNEKLALRAYINGLNNPLKNILRARKIENLDDLIRDALELEAEENIRNPQLTSSKSCTYCHRTNHTIDQCFRRNNNRNNSFNNSNQNRFNNNNRNYSNNNSNNNGNTRSGNSNYNNSNKNSNFNSGRNNNNSNYNNNQSSNSNNNNNRNSQNYSNRNNNLNNNNNNRNGGNYRYNGNSSQSNGNSNRQNSNQHVRFVESEQKNETLQTANVDNASLNFLLN